MVHPISRRRSLRAMASMAAVATSAALPWMGVLMAARSAWACAAALHHEVCAPRLRNPGWACRWPRAAHGPAPQHYIMRCVHPGLRNPGWTCLRPRAAHGPVQHHLIMLCMAQVKKVLGHAISPWAFQDVRLVKYICSPPDMEQFLGGGLLAVLARADVVNSQSPSR